VSRISWCAAVSCHLPGRSFRHAGRRPGRPGRYEGSSSGLGLSLTESWPAPARRKEGSIAMHTSQKATAALALLALGWIGAAATPAFADQHGVADKAAAYQASSSAASASCSVYWYCAAVARPPTVTSCAG
jgi:hypothetical protein